MRKRLRSPSGVQRGKQEAGDAAVGLGEDEEGVAHRRRAEPLVADRARTRRRARRRSPASPTVVLARTSEPPCFSVIAIPQSAPPSRVAGRDALVVGEREEARLPLRRPARAACAAPGSPSRSSRSGSRPRPRPAIRQHELGARGRRGRPGPGSRQGEACSPCADRRSASARARRGGTRPRRRGCRSGRGCAARACSRWPAAPQRDRLPRAADRRRARAIRSSAHSAPSRRSASTSGRSASKRL